MKFCSLAELRDRLQLKAKQLALNRVKLLSYAEVLYLKFRNILKTACQQK